MARVLIVNDDGNLRGAVAEYLNADGYEVVEKAQRTAFWSTSSCRGWVGFRPSKR
jgi:DNA-binding response OmpR family regulator